MRIAPRDIRLAGSLLRPLLRPCGGLDQARREWGWIKAELPRDQWLGARTRRSNYEPLQYILGNQPFGNLLIKCRPNVLIPRWETEEWTLKLCDLLRTNLPNAKVIDACTGTGCIPLTIADEVECATVLAFDISPEALELSKENAGSKIDIFRHDVFERLEIPADIITANPPYIPVKDMTPIGRVERLVNQWEPHLALVGDIEFYDALIDNVVLPLGAEGFVFELGYIHQANHVAKRLPHWSTTVYYDSAKNVRCVVGWKSLASSWLADI